MSSEVILTNYAIQQITQAISTGSTINITTAKFGSSNNFTLSPTMTDISNVVYTTSSPTVMSSVIVREDTMEVRLYLGTDIGTFNIGCVGIYDNTNHLFMVAKLEYEDPDHAGQYIPYHKVETTDSTPGNTLQFKLPINVANVSQLITCTGTQFNVDGVTILLSEDNRLTSAVVPHHVFDIFQNASLSNPPGAFPLWTGELVYCDGVRDEFFSQAVTHANAGHIRTLTQSQYDSEVNSKGWTNAFVINSTNKTIRLPKYKGILWMNTPGVSTPSFNYATSTSTSNNYGFISLPTFIQVDTVAVPATMAQCNEFTTILENYAAQFVTLSTTQTNITGNKTLKGNNTHSGTNSFTGNVTFSSLVTFNGNAAHNGQETFSGALTISGNSSFSGTNTHSGQETFTGNTIVPTLAVNDTSTKAVNAAFISNKFKFINSSSLPSTLVAGTWYALPENPV